MAVVMKNVVDWFYIEAERAGLRMHHDIVEAASLEGNSGASENIRMKEGLIDPAGRG